MTELSDAVSGHRLEQPQARHLVWLALLSYPSLVAAFLCAVIYAPK